MGESHLVTSRIAAVKGVVMGKGSASVGKTAAVSYFVVMVKAVYPAGKPAKAVRAAAPAIITRAAATVITQPTAAATYAVIAQIVHPATAMIFAAAIAIVAIATAGT